VQVKTLHEKNIIPEYYQDPAFGPSKQPLFFGLRCARSIAAIMLSLSPAFLRLTRSSGSIASEGTEIRVKTERPEVSISLSEMAKDSWVVFELPGFANATSGKQQDSIDALRKATETSYFKGPDAVWVKLVIPTAPKGIGMDQFGPSDTQASITVRR
jgi:hypothetical protein